MRQSYLLSSVAFAALTLPIAMANTNAGGKLYVCSTPQPADLDKAGFEALTWVEVKNLGNHGETGSNTNIVTYPTWDQLVLQKAKGTTDAGSPEVQVARIAEDPGQVIMRNAAETNFNYATKLVMNDKPNETGTGTTYYNRGLVTGPRQPHGGNEDFQVEIYQLALNQKQLVVEPVAGA